jgi:hypothetical protein
MHMSEDTPLAHDTHTKKKKATSDDKPVAYVTTKTKIIQ